MAEVFQEDLAAARSAWVEEAVTPEDRAKREGSSVLSYRDDSGRFADFHALRHTFITNLATGGVHPKTAQTLARHSAITLKSVLHSSNANSAPTPAEGNVERIVTG